MDWTEIKITVDTKDIDTAGDIANMVVPYGIYIEDYSDLEREAMEIAHIDLIDEELLAKDRTKGIVHIYIDPQDHPQEAAAFLTERLAAAGIENEIDLTPCKNADWENNWKQYFHPIKIGERLLIRPTWEDEYDADGRAVLHLEPGLAFGTGSHETTRLCLEALEKNIKGGERVLDVGCGSGILAIASLLLGAESATGVDIDELAVKTAEENGKMNGFDGDRLKFIHGDLADKVSGKFDIVVANIVADIIIMFCKTVPEFMANNAVFITSGIIDIREQEVVDAFAENGFEIIARHADGGWRCFECRRKN